VNMTLGFEAYGKYGYFKVCNFTNVSPKWVLCFISLDKDIMSFNNMHWIFYRIGNTHIEAPSF
jgi:hypothetical protein